MKTYICTCTFLEQSNKFEAIVIMVDAISRKIARAEVGRRVMYVSNIRYDQIVGISIKKIKDEKLDAYFGKVF